MGGKTEAREDVLCLSHLSFVKWRKETFCNNEWLEAGDELNSSTFNVKVKTLRSEEERFPGIMKTQRSCFFYCKSNYLFSLQRCWCEASFHSREMITRSFHPASKTHIERTDHIFHLNAPIQFIWNIMNGRKMDAKRNHTQLNTANSPSPSCIYPFLQICLVY